MRAPHRAGPLARRTLGVSVVAALMVAVLPAAPAFADGSVSVVSTDDQPGATAAPNSRDAKVIIQTSSTLPYGPQAIVTFTRTGTTNDKPSVLLVSAGVDKKMTLTVSLNLANPGTYDIKVVQNGSAGPAQTDTCTACFTVASADPVVTGVSAPTIAQTGSAAPFTVSGTHFARGNYPTPSANYNCASCAAAPTLKISRAGVAQTGIVLAETRNSNDAEAPTASTATTITKIISVGSAVPTGAYDVVVTNSDGNSGTCAGCFTVAPAMTGTASPSSLGQGTTGGTITITGTNFPTDLTGAILRTKDPLDPTDDGDPQMTGTFVRDSATQARFLNVAIQESAIKGARVLYLASASQHDGLGVPFSVIGAPVATSSDLTDGAGDSYGQGATNVHLTVTGSDFTTGANSAGTTVVFDPPTGITVTASQAVNTGSVVATLTIAPDAPVGDRTISVKSPNGGQAVCGDILGDCLLTITAAPVITSVSPASAGRDSTHTFTITGTDLSDGSSSAQAPTITIGGVTGGTSSLDSNNKDTIARYSNGKVSKTIAAGPQPVTVINSDTLGRRTCTTCFAITNLEVSGPSNQAGFNSSVRTGVTVQGNGFDKAATVELVKIGLGSATVPAIPGTVTTAPSTTSPTAADGTSLIASFPLNGVDPGSYAFRVTNPTGSTFPGLGQGGLFNVVADGPTITAVAPSSRGTGAQGETITLTGTNFWPHPSSVAFSNAGVHVDSVTRVSATRVDVVVHIDENATPGAGTVTLTSTDNSTAQSAFTVVAGPHFSSTSPGITPNTRAAGSSPFGATVKGEPTTFPASANAALLFSNPNVTATGVAVTQGSEAGTLPGDPAVDDTLTGTVRVAGGPAGPVDVIVRDTSTGGRSVCTGCFTVTASAPSAPTAVTATPGNGQAVVTWTPGADNGSAITGYTVTASPGGATTTSTTPSATVTGLTNGTAYTFTVVERNAIGSSPASAPSAPVTPRTVPGAPANLAATPGNGQVALTWSAPSTGGSPITGYVITYNPGAGSQSAAANALGATVTGLTNGTAYTFTVRATNAIGDSASSLPVTATPRTVPGAPTGVTAVAATRSANVSWTAPGNGGAIITSYVVTSSPGGKTATVTGSPAATAATVTGLTSGTAYTFTVVARNAAGTGAASAPSNAVQTPLTAPAAPAGVSGTPGNGAAVVSWTAPENGGSAITSYRVTAAPGGAFAVVTGNPATTSTVVSGLTNGTAYTFTVVATNSSGNGPASAPSAAVTPKFASRLTQAGTNATTRYGTTITVTGTLTRLDSANNATPLASVPMRVYLNFDDGSYTSAGVTTSSTGVWKLTLKPTRNTVYVAKYFGDGATHEAVSPARRINVASAVSITSPANGSSSDNASALVIKGSVAPNKANQIVTLYQVNRDGSKAPIKQVRLSSSSTYAFNLGATVTGTFTFVVGILATPNNAAGTSGVLTVHRT